MVEMYVMAWQDLGGGGLIGGGSHLSLWGNGKARHYSKLVYRALPAEVFFCKTYIIELVKQSVKV